LLAIAKAFNPHNFKSYDDIPKEEMKLELKKKSSMFVLSKMQTLRF